MGSLDNGAPRSRFGTANRFEKKGSRYVSAKHTVKWGKGLASPGPSYNPQNGCIGAMVSRTKKLAMAKCLSARPPRRKAQTARELGRARASSRSSFLYGDNKREGDTAFERPMMRRHEAPGPGAYNPPSEFPDDNYLHPLRKTRPPATARPKSRSLRLSKSNSSTTKKSPHEQHTPEPMQLNAVAKMAKHRLTTALLQGKVSTAPPPGDAVEGDESDEVPIAQKAIEAAAKLLAAQKPKRRR